MGSVESTIAEDDEDDEDEEHDGWRPEESAASLRPMLALVSAAALSVVAACLALSLAAAVEPDEALPVLAFIGAIQVTGLGMLWKKLQTDPDIRHHQRPTILGAANPVTPNTHLFGTRTQNVRVRLETEPEFRAQAEKN
ncbi:hypothetical protein BGW39_009724 [Mortierella sp. 14UC]|nr:hypothetical protein BGW39_009724 [Mortierella sp. 14UC]